MGACVSCLGLGGSSGNDGEGDNERTLLLDENGGETSSLAAQLRDAKLLAVLNATNDRLLDHDDTENDTDVTIVGPEIIENEIKDQENHLDSELLQNAIKIKQ